MSKYEKPMVMINEELAEGVYAASGAECWAVSEAISVQDWDGESHVFQMKFRHSTDYQHTTDGFSVTVTFSNNITKARSNESGDMVGSNSISFTRFGHSRAMRSLGIFMMKSKYSNDLSSIFISFPFIFFIAPFMAQNIFYFSAN